MSRIDVPIDVFKCGVVAWIGDRDRMRTTLAADGFIIPDAEFADIGDAVGAVLDFQNEPDKLIWMETFDFCVLIHEAVHAAKRMLDEKGISDEETLCYLVEYLVRVISSRAGFRSLLSSGGTSRKRAKQSARFSRHDRS